MFDSPPSHQVDERPAAVVIGAGFGGLAAAIRLGARGYKVTVLEKNEQPGGRASVYRQDGFVWDAGPTIVTAPYLFEELWALCGRRMTDDIDLRPMDPFYTIRFDDGVELACTADVDRMKAEIGRIAPEDVASFERYLAESAEIYRIAFAELADQPFHELKTLIRSAPDLIRLQGFRTVASKIGDYFTHPKLRFAFSFHPLLIGGNPFSTTAYYCLIAHLERKHGVHYAMGGTGALVDGLVGLIGGQGGTVRCDAEVDRILTAGDRVTGVRLADGEEIPAPVVVSNADVGWTYTRLLSHRPKRRWTEEKFRRANHSMSLFVWYFGTNRRYEEVGHHTIILGPRFKELLDDIFTRKVLAPDFSIYLHRPSATDPSVAPEGADCFYALTPVPNLDGGQDWSAEAAEAMRARIQKRLEETVLPGLSGHVVASRLLTPFDFRDRYLSLKGAAFATEPVLFQSAWFRPHNLSEEVQGLYLVGAGTHPGAGLPGVLSSARVLDKLVPHAATAA